MCLARVVLAACTTKEARRTDSAAGSTAPTLAGAPAADANAVKQAVDASLAGSGARVELASTAPVAA